MWHQIEGFVRNHALFVVGCLVAFSIVLWVFKMPSRRFAARRPVGSRRWSRRKSTFAQAQGRSVRRRWAQAPTRRWVPVGRRSQPVAMGPSRRRFAKGALKVAPAQQRVHPLLKFNPWLNPGKGVSIVGGMNNYVLIESRASRSLSTQSTKSVFLVCMFLPCSARCFMMVEEAATTDIRLGQYGEQPVDLRALRQAIHIQNTTTRDKVGGSIRTLALNTHLDLRFSTSGVPTTATMTMLKDAMNNSTNMRSFTAHDFIHGHTFVQAPGALVDYRSYQQYEAAIGWDVMDEFLHRKFSGPVPMTSIVIEFGTMPDTATNSYDITIFAQDGCRYGLGHVLQGQHHSNNQRVSEIDAQSASRHVEFTSGALPGGYLFFR